MERDQKVSVVSVWSRTEYISEVSNKEGKANFARLVSAEWYVVNHKALTRGVKDW